jgi:signal transduction histidine kinase
MTFRNKILFSIWGVVLSLLVITFFIINYWTRSSIEGTFARELRTGFSTVLVHEQLQAAQLIRACAVLAESPRLRAVVELGDAKTAFQLLQELNQSALIQVLVLTDRRGKPLVQLLHGVRDQWDLSGSAAIQSALHATAASDTWPIRGNVYRVVSVPIMIATDLVGTLTIGFEITETDIQRLKRATNSDFLLVLRQATVLATLDSAEVRLLLPAITPIHTHMLVAGEDTIGSPLALTTPQETYLATAFLLHQPSGTDSSAVFYLIVKPLSREVRQAMTPILGTFGIVSLVFLGLTTILGVVISRGITRPISELVRGTTEITRGNYDYAIRVRGRDELSILAGHFKDMSSSLKEKITELGRLNQDLLERNRDLDDTLRKLQSAQEELVRSERLAATGKMTAQLAHEINNPIHNIQSCLHTALNRLPGDIKGRDLIAVAYDEVNRLSRLTVQMLNLYRGSLVDEEMKPTNLNELLSEIITLIQSELTNNGIMLHTRIDPDLPFVRGSRDKLKQVLLNLIANARDAMPGGGELEILGRAQDRAVRMTVRDTGGGIAGEHRDRIFDAFFTTKGKVSGVGLGLSVSYGIVQQHRGSIEVESSVGRGSAFTVVLPYEG